jgi:hypothetical protein
MDRAFNTLRTGLSMMSAQKNIAIFEPIISQTSPWPRRQAWVLHLNKSKKKD